MLRRLLASPWPYFVLAGIFLLVAVLTQIHIGIPTRPRGDVSQLKSLHERRDLNVILVVVGSLRADHLSAYGYEKPTSPLLDQLAAGGVRFAHVLAQSSWTKSSMASLWQAAYPVRTGILRYDQAIPASAVLPAKELRAAGFRTAGIHRNPWLDARFGFANGFEDYLVPTPAPAEAGSTSAPEPSDRDLTASALEFIRAHESERFFLYVHYMDVTRGYSGELGPAFGSLRADLYDASVRWVDLNLARLQQELEDRNLSKKTIFVVASDQGAELAEHGGAGEGQTLYHEVLEVPLLVNLPFRLRPGLVVDEPVENVDLWPTLLDLLGQPPLPKSDGRSLVPLIEAAATPPPSNAGFHGWTRPSFAEVDRSWGTPGMPPNRIVSVTSGTLQLISPEKGGGDPELFDVLSDAAEQRNLAPDQPESVSDLRKQIDSYRQLPPLGAPSTVVLDARALEILGIRSDPSRVPEAPRESR